MNEWKRRIRTATIVLCVVLLAGMGICSASEIERRYSYISSISCSTSISGNTVSFIGGANGSSNDTSTVVLVSLQRKLSSSSAWSTVETHRSTGSAGAIVGYSGTATADTGYDYRTYVWCKIYDADGNLLESKTKTSGVASK